jgi:hypothetical protein
MHYRSFRDSREKRCLSARPGFKQGNPEYKKIVKKVKRQKKPFEGEVKFYLIGCGV